MAQVPPLSAVGSQPGSQPVTLGGVQFWTREAPADFKIGGVEQKLATLELIGGGRSVQSLGPQPKQFTFRGKFMADRVASQIPAIRLLCTTGAPVSLTYGSESWSVIVKDVEPTYRNQWWAIYDITIEPVSSNNGALGGSGGSAGSSSGSASQDQQSNAQQQQASGINNDLVQLDPTGTAGFQNDLATLFTDLQGAGPLASLSKSETQALVNDVNVAVSAVTAYQATQSQTSQTYVLALQLINVLTLMDKNISAAPTSQTIVVQGGNLYYIASKYYRDPTMAYAIMEANGLPSPFLSTQVPTTLVLPAAA